MATTNIELDIENITGVADADDQFIKTAQKFVVASIPKDLMMWAGTSTAVATHGGDSSPTAITLPQPTDNILDVQRNGFSAEQVPESMQGFIASTASLHLATETYPKYYIQAGNKVIVKPDPSDSETALVNYVDFLKIDDDCDLRSAVIFHACSSEFSKLSTAALPTVSIAAVPPDVPSLTTVTFTSTDSDLDASAPTFTTAAVAAAGVLGTTNGFNAYHPLSDLGDSDPGVFSISSAAPAISISGGSVAAISIAALPTAPSYTPPTVGGATESLTAAMTAGTAGTDADQIDYSDWWEVLADMIEDEEDTELAAAQIQKINSYIGAYQAALQDSLNTFNEANALYQAGLQRNLQQAQINAQDSQKEADMALQASIQDASLELQKYQAGVNSEVQQYSQKLARYQLELNTTLQSWQKEYDASIQESLQELQVANQVNIALGQASLQVAIDNENRSQQRQLQNGINDMQAIVASNQDLISKYQSELQQYSGEVQAEVSEYQNKIQKQQSLSKEADKYYQWAKLEVTTYIQNNSKMIAATMAGRARAQA